jgi:hypothetical protein
MKDAKNDKYHEDSEWKEWADHVIEKGTPQEFEELLASMGIITKKRKRKLDKLFKQFKNEIASTINYELPKKDK